jgi:hypothetical protein
VDLQRSRRRGGKDGGWFAAAGIHALILSRAP